MFNEIRHLETIVNVLVIPRNAFCFVHPERQQSCVCRCATTSNGPSGRAGWHGHQLTMLLFAPRARRSEKNKNNRHAVGWERGRRDSLAQQWQNTVGGRYLCSGTFLGAPTAGAIFRGSLGGRYVPTTSSLFVSTTTHQFTSSDRGVEPRQFVDDYQSLDRKSSETGLWENKVCDFCLRVNLQSAGSIVGPRYFTHFVLGTH